MTDKEFRRLSRADLIEIIYELRTREAELMEENKALRQQLADKHAKVSEVGSLAELSAALNGLFEAAQATADQYLQEIRAQRDAAVQAAGSLEAVSAVTEGAAEGASGTAFEVGAESVTEGISESDAAAQPEGE